MNIDLKLYPYGQPMSMKLWALVDHFVVTENWGDPYKMNVHMIYWLDAFRSYIDDTLHIHCAFESAGHETNGQHFTMINGIRIGNAVDLHAENMKPLDLLLAAMMFPFNGIGYYPYWNNVGLHLDMRMLQPSIARKMWWRDKGGSYHNIDGTNASLIVRTF